MNRNRLFGVLLALTAITASVATPEAWAGATVFSFHFEQPDVFETSLPECLPADLVGLSTGVEITDGQAVETPSGGSNVQATTAFPYRVDFPDGRYVLGNGIEHFGFHFSRGETVSIKSVVKEARTVYDANGQPIGSGTIHANSHTTFHDANGNGQPDDGEVTASVDKFDFTCK
jgi:acid stress-induced BolA-like protein IbaG/YrbA